MLSGSRTREKGRQMDIRVIRDNKKVEDETTQIVAAITWATLVQEQTKDAWKLTDDEIREMVRTKTADLLDYDATHDEWGNTVDGMIVRLGRGGYSVSTCFDNPLPEAIDNTAVDPV